MAVTPDTTKVAHLIHDTIRVVVRDTLYRVGEPQHHQAPTWLVTSITAMAAVVAAVLAQMIRVVLDDNRERERIRHVLLNEVAVVAIYLERIATLADAWQLPAGDHFWRQLDDAMRGYDEVHTKMILLPRGVRGPATAWFLRVKSLRFGAQYVAEDYARQHEAVQQNKVLSREFEQTFGHVVEDTWAERKKADELYEKLYDASPRVWWQKIGLGERQEHRTLQDAREAGETFGLPPSKRG